MNQKKPGYNFAEIEQLARSHQLGEPRLSFKNPASRLRPLFTRAIAFISIVPVSVLLFLLCFFFLKEKFVQLWAYFSLFCFYFGMFSFALALKFDLPRYRRLKKEQVHLFEHGFIYFDEKKNVLSALRWEQMKGLGTCGKQRGTKWLTGLAIITKIPEMKIFTEYFFFIPDLPEIQEICELVNRAYISYYLPLRLRDYERGERLVFDIDVDDAADDDGNISLCNLELSRDGMKQVFSVLKGYFPEVESEEFISWDEIASIEIEERSIVMKTKEPLIVEGMNRASDTWFVVECSPWGDMSLLRELLMHIYHQTTE